MYMYVYIYIYMYMYISLANLEEFLWYPEAPIRKQKKPLSINLMVMHF